MLKYLQVFHNSTTRRLNFLTIWVVAFLLFFFLLEAVSDAESPAAPEEPRETEKIASLQGILDSVEQIERELANKRDALAKSMSEKQRAELQAEIYELRIRLRTFNDDFAEIASGVNIRLFGKKQAQEFDWSEELKKILEPLMDEISRLTARPREIDRLQREISSASDKLSTIRNARKRVSELIDVVGDGGIANALNDLEKRWLREARYLETMLAADKEQLRQKIGGRKTFSETAQELFRLFFKSRGRNLVVSFLAFFAVWGLLRKLHGCVRRVFGLQKSGRTYSVRVFDLTYTVITALTALLALLGVLYVTGDWVLLTIAAIFIFGIAWASKQGLPRFWEQGKLLLNLGTVREGERVVYDGLPWQVKSISFYTNFVNRDLRGGDIRLPLADLLDMHSRPFDDQEPWFPAKEGDWVLLADGTHGKVIVQTPEMVELALLGIGRKIYPAAGFLKENPVNLSRDFRLCVVFGIDHQHQPIVTQEAPAKLKSMLNERLGEFGYAKYLLEMMVEFREAGRSSLDIEVIADFSGDVAGKYYDLQRAMQRICVEACNKYGWVIPFNQLTMHAASGDPRDLGKKLKTEG